MWDFALQIYYFFFLFHYYLIEHQHMVHLDGFFTLILHIYFYTANYAGSLFISSRDYVDHRDH